MESAFSAAMGLPFLRAASRGMVVGASIQAETCTRRRLSDGILVTVAERAFHALADPRRRAMLRLVRDQPRSVNEIAKHFDITQQAVSQHLQVLKDAGLVAVRPQAQRRLYVVRPEGLDSLRDFLAEFWPAQLADLKREMESSDGA